MPDTTAQTLCTQCGLCCGGAIFADVELRDKREAISMESLGLEIEEEDGRSLLIQPCRALRGAECSVYAHRPECCRSFECQILKDFRNGIMSRAKAFGAVCDLKEKLAGNDPELARRIIDTKFLNRRD